jgi:hypothetical protein
MHEASRSNPEPPPRRSRLAPRLAGGVRNAVLHLATWALLVFYVLKRAAHPGLANHDVGWTVFAGGVLLDGGVFGVDVVDNNPPLVYWLCAGVVALARLLGLPPLSVYYVAALALVFVSVTLLRRLLRVTFESAAWGDALSLVVGCGLVIGPGIHFGQRDAPGPTRRRGGVCESRSVRWRGSASHSSRTSRCCGSASRRSWRSGVARCGT